MNTANNTHSDQPLLQVNHWLAQLIGLVAAIVFLFFAFLGFSTGQYLQMLFLVGLAAAGIFVFILYGKTEMSEEIIVHKSRFGHFRMKWDEVKGIETDLMDDTIVFKGEGKQLAIPGTSFWSGKDKKRMLELYSRQIELRQITVKYTQAAMFAISRGTR